MFKKVAFSMFLGFFAWNAHALFDLELTQGSSMAAPVSVSFENNNRFLMPDHQSFSQVIERDLQNSGEFRATELKNADYVVSGRLDSNGSEVRIHVILTTSARTHSVLLDQSFSSHSSGLRRLAHHISDVVYEKMTGLRGIFSTKIAYVVISKTTTGHSQYALQVSDADGWNVHTVLVSREPIMSPAWMPNGQQLAYVSFEGHRAKIYIQNLFTGKRFVASDFEGINGSPAFSSDGKWMALVLSRTGNPNIYILNLSTRTARALTHGGSIDTEPSFSEDGQSVLFTSNRQGTPQIYAINLHSGVIQRLTHQGNYNARASFVPGKTMNIVCMNRGPQGFGIAVFNRSTGIFKVLTASGHDESPSMAPNGRMIVYATYVHGRRILAQVSLDGRIKLLLPMSHGMAQEPVWSPFL